MTHTDILKSLIQMLDVNRRESLEYTSKLCSIREEFIHNLTEEDLENSLLAGHDLCSGILCDQCPFDNPGKSIQMLQQLIPLAQMSDLVVDDSD